MEKKKSLKKSIMFRGGLLIVTLSLGLAVFNYFGYKNALFSRYRAYITDLLKYAEANIDVDDMKICLESGKKSEKFNETQGLFDTIKDTHDIDYIYVIKPLNTEPVDNVMNVIAGMSSYEKEHVPENEVTLGGLTGNDYNAETVRKYYDAMDKQDQVVFIEEWADRWGLEYTGILSLYDSNGEYFAELCVNVPIPEIKTVISNHIIAADLFVLVIGLFFTFISLAWIKKSVTDPIQEIEKNVTELADKSYGQTDPNALVIDMPDIRTENELQSLAESITRLSRAMRDYLKNELTARNDAQSARARALEMREETTRDFLTGIRNRHAYEEEVKKLDWKIKADGFTDFGIAVVDVNYLKRINDTYGHEKGNQAIIKMCTIVCRIFSHSPVFRTGGDEFIVILENEDYRQVNDRMTELDCTILALMEDDSLKPWEQVSATIGWDMFDPEVDHNVESVFKRANLKMFDNKKKMKTGSKGHNAFKLV